MERSGSAIRRARPGSRSLPVHRGGRHDPRDGLAAPAGEAARCPAARRARRCWVAAACWGIVTPAEKYAVTAVGAFTTPAVECAAAAVLIAVPYRLAGRSRPTADRERQGLRWQYALLGLLEPGLAFGALDLGCATRRRRPTRCRTGCSRASCSSWGRSRERKGPTARAAAAVAVAAAGAGAVVLAAWHAALAVGAAGTCCPPGRADLAP